jgi:hypothetical protein
LNITNPEIQWPGMLIIRKICGVSLVQCSNDWHNSCSGRKLILCIPALIGHVNLAVYSMTLRVCKVHWFKIEAYLKWKLCWVELDVFENIPVVQCYQDM